MTAAMKICICTTPIRSYATNYPPLGSLAIIQSLRKTGADVDFYHLDYFRYSFDQISAYFASNHYDFVGISAVVSTAYAYTKQLAELIRAASPETTIILGGNLATSAEVILRKTEIDFCVVGDGEITIQSLIRVLSKKPCDYDELRAITGICFLDHHNKFNFTGFGERPSANDIEFPDYSILESIGVLPYYISDIDDRFGYSVKAKPGEKCATVVMNKGCVSHCTFCHRWEKGYRSLPVEKIISHVRELKDKHNVRFIDVGDENFGSDRKSAWELVSKLGELGIVWRASGVRTNTVSRESLLHWKNNGCVSVGYGVESGSPAMLKVMEKNLSLDDNINALVWTGEAGLETVIQLVIGMPGENDVTIGESIDFLKKISSSILLWRDYPPSEGLSINFAQALPGTPLYEYARERGLIGKTLEEEEAYLLKVSDINAGATGHYLNYTEQSLLKALTWRVRILSEIDAYMLKQKGISNLSFWWILSFYSKRLRNIFWKSKSGHASSINNTKQPSDFISDSGYFNISRNFNFAPILLNSLTRPFFNFFLLVGAVGREFVEGKSLSFVTSLVVRHIQWKIKNAFHAMHDSSFASPAQSLRKTIAITHQKNIQEDPMIPLRKGR
ncbi:MAG: radical SAM protein [Gallionella sp.]|nr:radical SAM protein [Gallionella sp.]